MHTRHLDEFARELSLVAPRRRALRILGGGLAALATTYGADNTSAKPKKTCKKKKKLGQKCKLNNGAKCKCLGGAKCKGGTCTCPNGTKEYVGACVPVTCRNNGLVCDPSSDCCSGHCGYLYNDFKCCVPTDGVCPHAGVCCQTASTPAKCEAGHCCRAAGAICDAVDSPLPPAKCCQGTFCSSETFRCEPM